MGSTESAGGAGFGMQDFDDAAERIRALNEKIITASKQSASMSLDAYERALSSVLDFELKAADATQLDWVAALAKVHADFVSDFSSAFVSASREALK